MKLVLSLLVLLTSASVYASDLYCNGVNGFEISNMPGNHAPWTVITVKQNGAVVVSELNDNDSVIQKDDATGDYVQIIRAVTVNNGVISSLILSIHLNDDGGQTGVGNAVIYDGKNTFVVNGLICKTP